MMGSFFFRNGLLSVFTNADMMMLMNSLSTSKPVFVFFFMNPIACILSPAIQSIADLNPLKKYLSLFQLACISSSPLSLTLESSSRHSSLSLFFFQYKLQSPFSPLPITASIDFAFLSLSLSRPNEPTHRNPNHRRERRKETIDNRYLS